MSLLDELYYSFDGKPIKGTVVFKLIDGTVLTLDAKYYSYSVGVDIDADLVIITKYELLPGENGDFTVLETVTIPTGNIVYYIEKEGGA